MICSAIRNLDELFALAYRPRRLIGCSPNTIKDWLIVLRGFSRWVGREPDLTDLDEDTISAYLAEFAVSHAPATTKGRRAKLLALARFAHSRGMIAETPDVALVHQEERLPDSFDEQQLRSLTRAAGQCQGFVCGIPAARFWVAVLLVAFCTGARAGAIFALTPADVVWRIPAIRFRAVTSKSKREQLLRVTPDTLAALVAIREPDRSLVFPEPWAIAGRYIRLKKIWEAAGLPTGRREFLQKFRRTCATMTHRAGLDATAQLGHSDARTTRQFYLDLSDAPQAADILPSIVRSDGQSRLF